MNIESIISTEYHEFSPDDQVSKLIGTFDDPTVHGVIVCGDQFEGVITRRQLITSHHKPEQKLRSLVWTVPRLAPDENVRKVAQLMLDSDTQFLPVFENDALVGVVTSDAVLREVKPFLDAATVGDVYSSEVVTVEPDGTLGKALHLFRDHRITHLPVIEESTAVGILSIYDVTGLAIRAMHRSQGGDPGGQDPFGGELSDSTGRTRGGGFGAREGDIERMLDLPVRNAMTAPVRRIEPDDTLETAVELMFDIDASSLVVADETGEFGIVTKSDVLESLTWETGGNRAVQVYNVDLLDDVTYDDVVSLIETFDDRDHGMNVLDARIHLHKHDETLRGVPLLLARIRLHTDQGLYMASGEGYGASHALNEARDTLERRIRDRKTYAKSKKPRSNEFWEKRLGWILKE